MTALLKADGITAGYGGDPVLLDVSLEVRPGEVVALLGANGAGKTTSLLSMVGQLPLTGGSLELFGKATRNSPLHRRVGSGLAFVPEGRSVFKGLTTADNLRVAGLNPEKVLELFPELATRMSVRGGLLSGGEQQMLTLGRALARKPRLLLADELSLGLAPKAVERLLEAVRSAADNEGMGALLVEQQVRKVLRFADRVYVMRRGRVEMSLTGTEAMSRISELEQAYLSSAN
jgi:branched-chain amino acid transport system ATP-binding protein